MRISLTVLFMVIFLILNVNSFVQPSYRKQLRTIKLSATEEASDALPAAVVPEIYENETPEEKYKREKLAEIEARKAAEVFITRNTGRFECQACGYIYDESVGLPKKGIVAGTIFEDIEKFRCPQCGVGKNYFVAETETLSGFKENQKFGLGGNSMTGGQKSNLIFGGLAFFFALFMSGYLLE